MAFIALQLFTPALSEAGGINEGLRQLFRKLDNRSQGVDDSMKWYVDSGYGASVQGV